MLKSTGIVRKVDELGRIVIPHELRRTMGIEEKDSLEIFVDGNKIILTKYAPGCTICGNLENLTYINNHPVCIDCIKALQKQALLDQATSKR